MLVQARYTTTKIIASSSETGWAISFNQKDLTETASRNKRGNLCKREFPEGLISCKQSHNKPGAEDTIGLTGNR